MPPKRIYLSRAQKRQRKEKSDALMRSIQGSMDRFLVQPANLNESDRSNDEFDDPMEDEKEINDETINEEDKKNEEDEEGIKATFFKNQKRLIEEEEEHSGSTFKRVIKIKL